MSELKPPQTTENTSTDTTFQRKFWAVIVISILAVLAFSYTISNLLRLEPTTAGYIKIALYAIAVGLSATSFILAIRRQVDQALTIIFYFLLIVQVANPATTQGRIFNATFSMLVIGTLMIGWLLPISSWRKNAAYLAGAFILALIFEWIDPSWRIDTGPSGALGPIVAGIFSVILVVLIVRETWGSSLRNKLIVSFIGITLVATVALGVPIVTESTRFLEENLERELTTLVVNRATEVGDLLSEQISVITTLSLNQVLLQEVEADNQSYQGSASAIQAELDAKDAQWRAADAANNNNDPLVSEHLTNSMAYELVEFQKAFPNHIEVFITDVYGGLAGTTNRTSDYYQADEGWWQAAFNDGQGAVYISAPEFDESANAVGVQIAVPLRDRVTGEITGILRTTYLMSALGPILQQSIGETGSLDLYVPGETVSHYHEGILEEAEPGLFAELQEVRGQGMVELVYEGELSVVTQAPIQTVEGNPAVDNLDWVVTFHQHRDEAFNQIQGQTQGVLYTGLIVLPLAALAAFGLSLFLVRPITRLTQTAEEVAAGNLGSRAEVTTGDEIGTLASTFNSMTSQLQDTLEGLEERVAARTKDLATVANISTVTATIRDPFEMLTNMVHLTQRGFNLYHAHVFTFDEEQDILSIVACGYREGDEHEGTHGTTTIPIGQEQSLVARAARTRRPVIVNDVRNEPGWLPNPLLPETRAELAVPMIVGDQLLGVLDVQSEHLDAFTEESANIQMTLASQIATALQNAQVRVDAQKRAEIESLANVIGRRIQRSASIEETLQIAIRELGSAIGAKRVKASIQSAPDTLDTEFRGSVRPTLVREAEISEQLPEVDEDVETNQAPAE